MTDNNAEPVAPEAEPEQTEPEENLDPAVLLAKKQKAVKEAQSLRQRVKELEPLAAKVQELEDAKKTDVERLTEQLTSTTQTAQEAQGEAMRLRVALNKGLTLNQAMRLHGSSQDELEADADALLADFAPAPAEPGRRPAEALQPGAVSTSMPLNGDPIEASLRTALGI